MRYNPTPQITDVQQAKATIPTVCVLAKALKWPLQQGATLGLTLWRRSNEPLPAIYAGGTRWTDHGTGQRRQHVRRSRKQE